MITATYSNTAPNDRSAVKPATFAAFLVLALTLPLRAGTITGVIHVIGGELSPGGIELFPDEVNNDGDNSGRGDPEFSGKNLYYSLVSRICGRLPAQVVAQVDDIAPLRSLRTF